MEGYNMMVSFLCMAGKVREAYGVLQEMKKGLSPDISSYYNMIMEACCKEDLIRPAKRFWDEMFANGYAGNLKTYNILTEKFSEIGQVEEVCRLFWQMFDKGVSPDAATYTFLLEGLRTEKHKDMAHEVFDKSTEQDAHLARTVLGAFIVYLCKDGQFVAASHLVCDCDLDIGDLDAHIVLLQCLTDA